MSFEDFKKKFPSLKECSKEAWIDSGYNEEPCDWVECVTITDVEKHCLDKETVRAVVIEKTKGALVNPGSLWLSETFRAELLKELGL